MNQTELDQHIAADEAERRSPYKDTLGLWTFGIGRCLETAPLTGPEWKALLDNGWITVSLSDPGAKYLLHVTEQGIIAVLKTYLPQWAKIDDVRQEVIIETCYQLGQHYLAKWNNTRVALQQSNWDAAADALADSDWARKQTPARAAMLIKTMRTGSWPT